MQHSGPKGEYTRYLPHIDKPNLYQGVTFRLADSLPSEVLDELHEQDQRKLNDVQRARLEKLDNAGYGKCWMRDPVNSKIVEDALLHFQDQRYHLFAWVVMPNHVHVLVRVFEDYSIADVISSRKGFTAHEINKHVGRKGQLWEKGFYDRYMRDWRHFLSAVAYIHNNPVKAGLVEHAVDWTFSSVRRFDDEMRLSTETGLLALKK